MIRAVSPKKKRENKLKILKNTLKPTFIRSLLFPINKTKKKLTSNFFRKALNNNNQMQIKYSVLISLLKRQKIFITTFILLCLGKNLI